MEDRAINEKTMSGRSLKCLGTVVLLALPLAACTGHHKAFEGCVDFESVPLGVNYVTFNSFTDSGATMTVDLFQWSNGTWVMGNQARADTDQMAGGSGKDINLNNVNLSFDFGPWGAEDLTVAVGEYGGNINILINGDFRNFQNFPDIHNTVIGGTQVSVTGGAQNQLGTLTITGQVDSFFIGGQELWIDDVCS